MLRMSSMEHPVVSIFFRQPRRFNNQNILGILRLRRLSEVVRAGNHNPLIYYHDLVMRYSMLLIDVGWDAGMCREVGRRILLLALGFVQDDFNVNASLLRINNGLGNQSGCEPICLD